MPNDNQTDQPCTVAIETHGCKLNQADSSALAAQFVAAGFRLVSTHEAADVYVVNSCTVTSVADRKARQSLRAARRRNPDATIVATGCYVQRCREDLRRLPEVDVVAGNTAKANLVSQVIRWRGEAPVPCAVGTDALPIGARNLRARAMIKIQEGCDQVCAYCIVPRVRGRERSVPPEVVLRDVREHVARGYKEVVLTGTQLGTYGFDLSKIDLTRLVQRILDQTGVPRLRVSSLQPQEIHPELLNLWSDARLCPHFHIPLQSGSDAVLKRMRRHYSAQMYARAVAMVRSTVPGVSITTDVIVGFPGEGGDHFQETRSLCEEVRFASMHVFPYSVRPGTSAAHLGGRVDPQTRSMRLHELLALSRRSASEFRRRFLGRTRPVLWERAAAAAGPHYWTGLTDNYIRVIGRSARPLSNEITRARLSRQEGDLVVAEVL